MSRFRRGDKNTADEDSDTSYSKFGENNTPTEKTCKVIFRTQPKKKVQTKLDLFEDNYFDRSRIHRKSD
jgi:hypothetical protein